MRLKVKSDAPSILAKQNSRINFCKSNVTDDIELLSVAKNQQKKLDQVRSLVSRFSKRKNREPVGKPLTPDLGSKCRLATVCP